MCGNNDAMAEESREEFLANDQEMLIKKFHLEADDDFIYINVLSKPYAVDRKEGYITEKGSQKKAPHDVMMAIYDLFNYHSGEREMPALSGDWKTVADLGGIIGAQHAKRLYNPMTISPFEGKVEQLKAVCEKLGGTAKKGGDVSFLLPLFDFFPVWFQFWDADDEFPADLSVLWDADTEAFIHYEILFYTTLYLEQFLAEQV